MKNKNLSLLAMIALFLFLCACSSNTIEKIDADSSTKTEFSSSKTVTPSVSETRTTSIQTTTAKPTTTITRALEVLKRGNSTWREILIKEQNGKNRVIRTCPPIFDLQKTITNADYVFSGTVISRKEYEVSWPSKNGKTLGPYNDSIIEVKVNHTYHGQSPVKGNIIKIYYPDTLSTEYEDVVWIKEQGEYVFVTKVMDKDFVERRKEENPDDGSEPEKYADVCVSVRGHNILPIENETVFSYRPYFSWNKEVMKKVKTNAKTNKIPPTLQEDKAYVALDKKEFDNVFNQLFEHPETLPTLK